MNLPTLFSRWCVIVGTLFASALAWCQISSPTAAAPMSLKGKTDQELLDLIRGPHSSLDGKPCETDSERKPSPLDRLWEMDPRDAAVAFAMDHISDSMKGMQL